MELYAGIDLHSNNSMVVVLDETDRVVYRKRLPNNLDGIISALRSCAGQIQGVAVESTFNWYWLVDGLQEAGYVVHLVEHGSGRSSMTGSSTAAMQPMPGTLRTCCAWAFCPRVYLSA